MFEIKQTEIFRKWRTGIKDENLRAAIAARLTRLARGLLGDAKSVGAGVREMRIHYGAGYRIYFHQRGNSLMILLCGGDKSSQDRDIKAAKRLLEHWDDNG